MEKLVSIITPLYNCEKFIRDTINSVKAQTYKNWEMLLIDDCSSDSSVGIVKNYMEKDKRIKLIRLTKNSGPVVARNTGINKAEGEYIAFLDSDDMWASDKLTRQIGFMEENNVGFTYTYYEKIDEEGIKLNQLVKGPDRVDYKDLLKTNYIGCLTAVYNQKSLGKIYMPNIRKRQDYGTWLRILKVEKYAYCIKENLAQYRIRKNSISQNKVALVKYNWKLFRDVEKLSLITSGYYLGCNVFYKIFLNK